MDDSELIRKAKAGDKGAFVVLFRKYKDRIYGYLSRYLNDYEAAKDLTLEVFLSVHNNLHDYEEMGKFSSWLYRIATNRAKRELRRRSARKEISLESTLKETDGINLKDVMPDGKEGPDYKASSNDLKEFVYGIVAKLNERYKDVLFLCYAEGLTYDEAGKVLGCSPETVHTRLRRARKMLRGLLTRYRNEL